MRKAVTIKLDEDLIAWAKQRQRKDNEKEETYKKEYSEVIEQCMRECRKVWEDLGV